MCQISEMHIRKKCMNPTDPIAVYVMWKKGQHQVQLGLCDTCWSKVPDDLEWGDSPKPTFEELFTDKARGLVGAVLTEYHPEEKGVKRHKKVGTIEDDISSHGLDRPIEEEEPQPYNFGDDKPIEGEG